MEKFKLLPMLLFCLALNLGLTSCGDDDDDIGSDNNEIENIIKSHVRVNSTYSDYSWDISITTSLSEVFPNKNIRYGINCGYDGQYPYDKFADGDGEYYTVKAPLYMTQSNTPFVSEGLYYNSYIALLPQYKSGSWNKSSDKEVFSFLSSVMKNSEEKALQRYCCRVFVYIDGDYYYVKQINGSTSTGEYSGGSGNGNNGGGESTNNGKAPSFYDFSYSYTETSISVIFATDPMATRATIYYGKSSPTTAVSTTISGRMISARITGLTKGTKYYVKCVASNSYGSTTSDVVSVMTDYY